MKELIKIHSPSNLTFDTKKKIIEAYEKISIEFLHIN